jgi:hypothetical protein
LDVSIAISVTLSTDGLLLVSLTTQHLALDAVGPSTPTRLCFCRTKDVDAGAKPRHDEKSQAQ